MMMVVSFAVFASAFAVAIFALSATFNGKFDRILAALQKRSPESRHPLARLVRAEQRIAARRWATQGRPVLAPRNRAAA